MSDDNLMISVEIIADEHGDGRECIYAGLLIEGETYIDVIAPTLEHALLKLIRQMGKTIAKLEGLESPDPIPELPPSDEGELLEKH